MKALCLCAALVSVGVTAAPMEVITVIYRAPVDYALYQQKAEIQGYFQAELKAAIRDDAQSQISSMHAAFIEGLPLATAHPTNNSSNATGIITAPQ